MSNKKDNPRFLHLAYHIHDNLFQDKFMIGGFYNWHLAFEGQFHLYNQKKGHLAEYDIIFVGLSKPELEGILLSRIREELGPNSDTKVVVCIDYARELWPNSFNPWNLEKEMMQADMIFVSDTGMVSPVVALTQNKIPVHHIVHPSNVEAIQQLAKPVEERLDQMASIIHRYDNNWYDVHLVDKNLPIDNHVVLLDPNIELHVLAYFNYTKHGFQFTQYLEWISHMKLALDSYHKIRTYGRTAVDNASLQLPTVGSSVTYSQQYLWPELTTEPGDLWGQAELVKKLLKDKEFYQDCVEYAMEKVSRYNYTNRKKELLEKLYN